MKPTKKPQGVAEFEAAHGGAKLSKLKRELAVKVAQVEALSDIQGKMVVETREDCTLRFGLTGDWHVGSHLFNHQALEGFYRYATERGIETFFHSGDVLDGHRVYKGQEFDLRDVGLDSQLERLARVAPPVGTTMFITGNHDASFKNLSGAPVGKMIEQAAPNMRFIGEDEARFEYQTPNGRFTIQMLHPDGGSAYALSYRPQKIVESLEGGTKPNLTCIGHYHKAEMMPAYRNVAVFQAGTFQRQTPFMVRKGLAAHVGGWIVEVTVGDLHNVIRAEFVAVY